MRVVMVRSRVVQDRGRAHTLDVGRPYELADVVARALLAEGAARVPTRDELTDDAHSRVPPETKPRRPAETKRRARR